LGSLDFTKLVQERSDGNFLYARYLLEMLEGGEETITEASLRALPPGLDALYLEFLERVVAGEADRYKPLFGILAVAFEKLSETQLASFVGMPADQVRSLLWRMRQFLDVDEALPAERRIYALFHRSFADFLLNGSHAGHFWCMASRQHRRVAESYDPTEIDDWDGYGKRYAAQHLAEASLGWDPSDLTERNRLTERLVALVNSPEFRRSRNADLLGLQRDLEITLRAAADNGNPAGLPFVARSVLELVKFREENLQPKPVFDLAEMGELEAAERRAALFHADADWYQAVLLSLAWLARDRSLDQARGLRDRVARALLPQDPLPLLLRRLDAALAENPPLQMPDLPSLPSDMRMRSR
jgi:hypothetical protein